jgi:hypothetical protein
MTKLGATSIQEIRLYGKQSGSDLLFWKQELKLDSQANYAQVLSDQSVEQSPISIAQKDDTLLECHGIASILILKSNGIVIRRLGGFLNPHKKGEHFISYDEILNVQVYEPGLSYGFLYFQLAGESVSTIEFMEAASSSNAITFTVKNSSEFEKVRILVLKNLVPVHSG